MSQRERQLIHVKHGKGLAAVASIRIAVPSH
jgi:hypothetical protein